MATNGRKKTKIIILVLAFLLAMNLCALAGTYFYKKHVASSNGTVAVPDNLITPEEDVMQNEPFEPLKTATQIQKINLKSSNNTTSETATKKKEAVSISLCKNYPQDNQSFAIKNMFPGDQETNYYGVQVFHHDKVTVHFIAHVREGYEKLAEVLKVRVTLLDENRVLYDGLMSEMTENISHELAASGQSDTCLFYDVTVYLDTSVGNEYQGKDLVADFQWWVEETDNLDKGPKTGDSLNQMLWIGAILVSVTLCIVTLHIRKNEEDRKHA